MSQDNIDDPLARLVPKPLSEKTHDNTELHFIGSAILRPSIIRDIVPGSVGSVGVMPAPAREDHEHGMASTGSAPPTDAADIVTGILPVARGGTGAGTLTVTEYLIGNGTGPVTTTTGPVSSTFVPSWVNFTPGNGLPVASYLTFGKMLVLELVFTLGNTSSVAAGGPIRLVIPGGNTALSVPVIAQGEYRDASTSRSYPIMAEVVSSGNSIDLYYQATGVVAGKVTREDTDSNSPFTWTNGDIIRLACLLFIL